MSTEIGTAQCFNMGGYKALYIADIETIKSITPVNDIKSNIVFNTGFDFVKLNMYNITVNSEQHGSAWLHTISGLIRTSESLYTVLNKLSKKRFICKIVDNNNISILIGSLEEPLRFTFSNVGPSNPADDKNYTINILGYTTEAQCEC